MKNSVFAAVVGLVSVLAGVVVACFLFGGYGAILAGVLAAVGLADCAGCYDPDGARVSGLHNQDRADLRPHKPGAASIQTERTTHTTRAHN